MYTIISLTLYKMPDDIRVDISRKSENDDIFFRIGAYLRVGKYSNETRYF